MTQDYYELYPEQLEVPEVEDCSSPVVPDTTEPGKGKKRIIVSDPLSMKVTPDFVIIISLMWELPDWISAMLMDRAFIRLSEYDRRHQALEHIRTVLWDKGIKEANDYLTAHGMETLRI